MNIQLRFELDSESTCDLNMCGVVGQDGSTAGKPSWANTGRQTVAECMVKKDAWSCNNGFVLLSNQI